MIYWNKNIVINKNRERLSHFVTVTVAIVTVTISAVFSVSHSTCPRANVYASIAVIKHKMHAKIECEKQIPTEQLQLDLYEEFYDIWRIVSNVANGK